MKITLTRIEKENIRDWENLLADADEEEAECIEDWLRDEWVISDNPADDTEKEAFKEEYTFPFKLITNGRFYDALAIYVFNCFSAEHQNQLKQSENFDKWKNLLSKINY